MQQPTSGGRAPRILFCVQNLSVPQDPRVWREARDLAAAGYRVRVVCPGGPSLARREVLDGVEIHRYPAPVERSGLAGQLIETATALFWTTVEALRMRRQGRIDVLHAANPPDTFFLVALLLRPFGTRFVFDQHDVSPELLLAKSGRRPLLLGLLRFLERRSYRTADVVITQNDSYRRRALAARTGKSADDVVVVRSGPDDVSPREPAAMNGQAVVSFAGVMDSQDGVELLVDATAELLKRRPDRVRLELIGSGDAVAELRDRASRLGIGSFVTWPGWLNGEELRDRLAHATVAVSPDPDNPFTRLSTMTKVTDYIGLGLPSIVADLPENRVTAGDAVLYFRPGDSSDLVARLEQLLEDADLRSTYASRARQRAPELLWAHSRERLLHTYERLVGAPSEMSGVH